MKMVGASLAGLHIECIQLCLRQSLDDVEVPAMILREPNRIGISRLVGFDRSPKSQSIAAQRQGDDRFVATISTAHWCAPPRPMGVNYFVFFCPFLVRMAHFRAEGLALACATSSRQVALHTQGSN